MTYTEIIDELEEIYDEAGTYEESNKRREAYIQALPETDRTAWRIVDTLLERKGFDYWWNENLGGMPSECNDEIFEELKQAIERKGLVAL